MQEKVWKYF